MNHRRLFLHALSLSVFASAPLLGCNTLLSNEEGTPRFVDGGVPLVLDGGAGDAGGAACDTTKGNKVCFGLCVRIDAPNTGCGGAGPASCAACDPKNVGAATCKGSPETQTLTCDYDACRPGFASCDGQGKNGCETSLGAKSSCGDCTTKCDVPTPYCAVTNGMPGCVDQCPAGTTDCDGACVNTDTSTENCGGCGVKCVRASATATCNQGTCVFTCTAGTHACVTATGTVCASEIDPQYCGPGCISCPPGGPNTVRTCSGGACGSRCATGYLDCDGVASNGCEVQGTLCIGPIGVCGFENCDKTQICCVDKCIPEGQVCGKLPPPPVP